MNKYSTPLVSVCVPTYNRPETLERTLTCLLSQTYGNIEIIISDNCSTNPDVQVVIDRYIADPRIQYIRQPANRGAIFNFNFVIEQATGDYVMRLADDDWLDNNYIETCMDFLFRNPDYVAAYGQAKICLSEIEVIRLDSEIDMIEQEGGDRVLHYFNKIIFNGQFYGIFRKEHLSYLKFTNELAIDWLAIARIAFQGKYKMVNGVHCYIATGGASQTIDHLTRSFNMSHFTRSFPFFKIGLNIIRDIVFSSPAYKKMAFFRRIKLGLRCALVIFRRFNVKTEVKSGLKKYVKLKLQRKQSGTVRQAIM